MPIAVSNGVGIWAAASDAFAARQGDVLVASSSNPNFTSLVALTPAGTQRYACEIPPVVPGSLDPSTYTSPTSLITGRWAVLEQTQCRNCLHNPPPKLRVFEVPGVSPATRGWVSAGGSPAGGSRPLP